MSRKILLTALTGLACFGSVPTFGQAGCTTENGCADGAACATGGCGEKLFGNGCTPLTNQLKAAGCGGGLLGGGCGDGFSLASMLGCDGDNGIELGGWLQFGYHNRNAVVPRFNTHEDRVNLHQGWLYAEKVADGSCGFDWGFRVDGMYGVDAADTQAFGNNPGKWDFQNGLDNGQYGFAIPQAYAEVASGDWSVKVGHFYTLVGYEVVTAPDNFFYSHALTMFNSEPFTHTGALLTYNASDDVTLYGGWTAGWDTGFDQLNNGSSFLGGFSAPLGDNVTFTYIATAGELGWRGNGYSHSIVVDTALTDNLNYVIQSDLVRTNDADANPATIDADDDIGINQYLIYSVSEKVGLGTRMEWWKNEGRSQYAATFGVNVKPMDNLIIRPEIRHDWKVAAPVGSQTTFGMDVILTF